MHVHFRACVLDGPYVREEVTGKLVFHPTPAPQEMDLQEILLCVHLRIRRLLKRQEVIRDLASDSSYCL